MDPYLGPRGPGSGPYNQSSYSYMGNLFDQNTYVEEPFSQGSRFDFQGNPRNPYQQVIGSDRNTTTISSLTNDQLGYDRYIPSSYPPPSDRLINNPFALVPHHERCTQNLDRQTGFERNIEQSFSSQGATNSTVRSSQGIMNDDLNNLKDIKQEYDRRADLGIDTNYKYMMKDDVETNAGETSMSSKSQSAEIDVDQAQVLSKSSDHAKAPTESAVDLSKSSNAADNEKESNNPVKEIMSIKQENIDDIESRDETDTDDTIIEEPKKKKKKKTLKKQKAKSEEKKDKSEEILKCKECDKVYSNANSFRKHQNYHAGLFKCKQCNKSWNSNYALVQHEKSHTGDKQGNLCGICGKTFSDTSSLNKHHKSVHEKLTHFSCDVCDLKFYAKKTFDEHMRVHTGERPFKCTLCPKTYKRVSDLNHHVRGHTGETKHVCELCGKGVRRLSELKLHMNAHRQKGELLSPKSIEKVNIVCNLCGKMFLRQNDLDRHTKEHRKGLEVMEPGLDRSEHDSLLIAAAIDSERHDSGHEDMFQTAHVDRIAYGKETLSERDLYYEQMKKLYRHATIRPESTQALKFDSRMPISDASFHAYFPIPSEEKKRMLDERSSNQVSTEKQVGNWLNNHFGSEQQKSNLLSSDHSIGHKSEFTEINRDEVQQTHISSPFKSTGIAKLGNAGNKPVVTKSNDNADSLTGSEILGSKVTESLEHNISSNVTSEKKETAVKNALGSKQKSITTVVDKLAEQKSKDFTNSENEDHIEIKMEVSDGGETDDYEFDAMDTVEEIIDKKPAKKKLPPKGKQKRNVKKDTVNANVKPKTAIKRQRKRKPKRIQKTSIKVEANDDNEEASLDDKIKKEMEAENDELNEAVNSALKDGLYLCTDCDKTFQTRGAYKNHKLMHMGLYTCAQCNRSLSSSWSLGQHMLTHTDGEGRAKFPCDVCGKSFCDKSSVNKHVRAVHMNYKPFKCDQCDLTFSERKTMREHMRVHTGERPFLCAHCPKTFKRVSELNHHIKGHTGETKHTCDVCGRGFRRHAELQRHATLHTDEKPHNCPVCGKDFRSFGSMREHTLRHYGHTGKHVCPQCGKHFFKRLKLERHLRSRKYCTNKCRYCLKEIPNPEERQKHESTHVNDGILKFVCTICGKRFRAKGHLNKHARIHSGEKPYVCEECGAAFIQSNHLKQHMRKHTGERPYHCLICGKNFAQSGTLYSHMKTHMSDNPQEMSKHLPMLKEMGMYQEGYDSGDSDNDIKVYGTIQDAVTMIGASVA